MKPRNNPLHAKLSKIFFKIKEFHRIEISYLFFLFFQSAEESELPVTSNIGPEGTERAIVAVDTASPSSSAQFASGNVTPPTSMAESASVTASLRVVYVLSWICLWFLILCPLFLQKRKWERKQNEKPLADFGLLWLGQSSFNDWFVPLPNFF